MNYSLPVNELAARAGWGAKEERYRSLIDSIDQGFCIVEVVFDDRQCGIDYIFLEINRAFEQTTGLYDVVGRSMRELRPEHETYWYETYGRIATTGRPERFESLARALGRWYNVFAFPIDAPELHRVAILFEDITPRKAAEQASARLAALTAHSAEAIVGIGTDGTIESWNRSAEQLFGYRAEEAIGQHISLLAPDDYHTARQRETGRRLLAGEIVRMETVCRRKDGHELQVLLTSGPIRDIGGSIIGVSASLIDISDRKAMERKLQDANRRKDEFLATLAHELRNPLAPIRNGLQIARLSAKSGSALHRTIDMMDRQLTHLVRLVDDLLDVSRISSGKIKLQRKRICLQDVVSASAESCEAGIAAHRHELILEPSAEKLFVEGDPARLTQVFSNLLSNSTKYTEPGGRIRVSVCRDGEYARVRVSDTGIGIPPDEIGQVFDLFTQVNMHEARADGGLGIGLSLVRNLVHMHGGTVEAESEGCGLGSTFTVQLPLARGVSAVQECSAQERSLGQPCEILVADDNVDAATSLAYLLELDGHRVTVAMDGMEASAKAAQLRPQVVILDLGMPRMDGLETARRIRKLPGGEHIALIALTGWGQDADRERTSAAGFDAHLVKPVNVRELTQVIAQRCEAKEHEARQPP
jgi:PAS domain S-box-containing protein